MIPISISEGTLCSLLRLLIQMLISSRNTITDTPRPSEHPLAQLRRQVTLRYIYINIYIYEYIHLCAQLCLTLCDTLDCSLPGSSVMGFSRQESWIGLPFPAPVESSQPRGQTCISGFADGFCTHWAIRDAHTLRCKPNKICCCCSVTQSCPTLQPHGQQHSRLPCPSLSPRVCWNSYPLSRWYHPTILSFVDPFPSYPQSFPASGSFPNESFQWALDIRWPKYWSFSVSHQSFQWILRVDFL